MNGKTTVGSTASQSYGIVLAVIVFVTILYVINKTTIGHTLIYYGLALLIFFTLLTQYQFISDALAPLNRTGN